MASLRRWLCQSGALFISVTTISPVISAPAISQTSSPSSLAPALPSSATKPPLPQDCLNIKDPSTDVISPSLSEAAKKTLDDIRDKNPNIRIDGCVALWIDEQRSFSDQILLNQKANHALLFFDKGINPKMLKADGTCIKENPEKGTPNHNNTIEIDITSTTTTAPSTISGRAFFMAKDPARPIENALLIGIPLNDDNTLAEGYFVGINHIYDDDSWTALASRESTFIIDEPGVMISGFTTWPVAYADKGYLSSNAAWHGNYINVVMNDESHSTLPGLTLYRNQFITMQVDPVTITHNGNSSNPDYLYSITENQFISCFSATLPADSAIDFKYTHRLPEASSAVKVKKTIKLASNRFHGQFQRHVISLELPSLTEALVEDNQYNENRADWESRVGEHDSEQDKNNNNYVLRAYGKVCPESNSHYPLVNVMNNIFSHPGVSVAADEQIKLRLMHNQLKGDKGAITESDKPVICSFDLTLEEGSTNNTYNNQLEASPCEGLKGKSVHGGFTFIDGTPCPPDYQPSTTTSTTETTSTATKPAASTTAKVTTTARSTSPAKATPAPLFLSTSTQAQTPLPTPSTTQSNKAPNSRSTEKPASPPLSTTLPSANSTIEASASRLNGTNPEEKQEGLGGGAIAGISIATAGVVVAAATFIVWLIKRRTSGNQRAINLHSSPTPVNYQQLIDNQQTQY